MNAQPTNNDNPREPIPPIFQRQEWTLYALSATLVFLALRYVVDTAVQFISSLF
jgi:hypothetical protein